MIIVVDYGVVSGVGDVQVLGAVLDVKELFHTFVCCNNFGFTRTLSRLFLSDGFPCNRATCSADEVAR